MAIAAGKDARAGFVRELSGMMDSSKPVFVGPEWGNLENGSLEYDYSEEVNYCYVLGQGEGASRETVAVSDTARSEASIWNLREGAKDARNIDYGDTSVLTGEGYTFLTEHKPKFRFTGDIVETPAFRYGREWRFGDKVTVTYYDIQKDAVIRKVKVSRTSDGQETVTARFEIEE